ncbi:MULTISPECIES: hypothetical protein [Metallosphaera]|uniref:Zinc finger, SWIM domain protein n=3 Tax=Metallosphaera TaxID=41980 RepID=A4YD13_METS5|nr:MULTISPECIES: hypothetical protein [Metallosphaera]ABP94315.1 zinc finger, SWIM domain protein [Metallosphaera sedula DSM 5348]AIM26302.1 zinc finger, SWIM domain protein [Metallosphaera sedula]AKV73314.1 hypothetical protein MsedA_0143 [Metallosphaera sedula]AKV75558.1 hypothetical protein MsedB_0143 [Metallosphaera sedula]AKV77804.1 hypothetical protein MsedC_0142 [Metallosphaera sedula]
MISAQIPKNPIKRLDVFYTLGEGVIVSADIESKSRKDVVHYTRIVLDPLSLKVIKTSCDCEGYTFRRHCWHIETLKQLLNDTKVKEEVEKAKEKARRIQQILEKIGR